MLRVRSNQLASTPRAVLYGRMGTCTQFHGTLVSWLVDVVNALIGHLDEPGGAMFPKPAAGGKNTAGNPVLSTPAGQHLSDALSNLDFMVSVDELARRLVAARRPERLLDWLLRSGPYGEGFGSSEGGLSLAHLHAHPHGIDLGALKARIPEVLRTPSGLVELAPPTLLDALASLLAAVTATPWARLPPTTGTARSGDRISDQSCCAST